MLPHPIDVCWDAAGRPEPDEPPCGPGRCVVTGRTYDRVWPVRQFLSNSFTETARLQTGETVSAAGWCAFKGWGWRCVTDRRTPWGKLAGPKVVGWIVTPTSVAGASPADMLDALTNPCERVAVAWGLSCQKHTLLWANWGIVSLDPGSLRWTPEHGEAARFAAWARHLGCPGPAFADPTPPAGWMSKLDTSDRTVVLQRWGTLAHTARIPGVAKCLEQATRHLRPEQETVK